MLKCKYFQKQFVNIIRVKRRILIKNEELNLKSEIKNGILNL